jgi:hypothetical protein
MKMIPWITGATDDSALILPGSPIMILYNHPIINKR